MCDLKPGDVVRIISTKIARKLKVYLIEETDYIVYSRHRDRVRLRNRHGELLKKDFPAAAFKVTKPARGLYVVKRCAA